jgi:hypothetical protein
VLRQSRSSLRVDDAKATLRFADYEKLFFHWILTSKIRDGALGMTMKWKRHFLILLMLISMPSYEQAYPPVSAVNTINSMIYVDGTKYTTVQSALNDLPSSGGTVIVPPGTYAGPIFIPNRTSLRCATWLGCTFTYSSNVAFGRRNGSDYFQMDLWGIIFDFGGTGAGLTLNAMQRSTFNIFLQNTTGDALTLKAVSGTNSPWPSLSNAMNKYEYLGMYNVGEGLVLNGDVNLSECGGGQSATGGAVFLNWFGKVDIEGVTGENGIKFTSGVDSLTFTDTYINLTRANVRGNGVTLGTRCPTSYGDIDLNELGHLTVDANGAGNTGIVANFSRTSIAAYEPGNGLGTKNSINANAYASVSINWVANAPFGNNTPSGANTPAYQTTNLMVTQQALLNALQPATSESNHYAPPLAWNSNVWNGSASVGSNWSCAPVAQNSGIPTFENLKCSYAGPNRDPLFLLGYPIAIGLTNDRGIIGGFYSNPAASANTASIVPPVSGTISQATVEYCGATRGVTQICAKTVEDLPLIIFGEVTLNGASNQSITALPFAAATYSCSGSDLTNTAGIVSFSSYTNASLTIAESGGGTADHLRYSCVGY